MRQVQTDDDHGLLCMGSNVPIHERPLRSLNPTRPTKPL